MNRTVSSTLWALGSIAFIVLVVWIAKIAGEPDPLIIEIPEIASDVEDLNIDRIAGHIRQLTAQDSRLSGYPGAEQAAGYIVDQLHQLGIQTIDTQEFETAVPMVKSAWLEAASPAGAVRIPLHPLWPNLARTCQTPAGGISGPLTDIGRGADGDLAGKPILDSIVVMDWDSNSEWLNVPEFGGKAIVFRATEGGVAGISRNKFLTVPANVPRYYVRAADVPALNQLLAAPGAASTIHCEMEWKRVTASNILARVSGDDIAPGTPVDHDATPLVLQAYYDSISVVPTLAPGAEQAVGTATMLELARFMTKLPGKPRRPVYLLFTGGHGQALSGIIRFTRTLSDGLRLGWPEAEKSRLWARMGKPGLFLNLDLSSQSDRFGLFCMGAFRGLQEPLVRPKYSRLALELEKFGKKYSKNMDPVREQPQFLDCINLVLGRTWNTYFPYRAPFESEVPTMAGLPGVTLSTVNDDRRYVDTPDDTPDRLDLARLSRQITWQDGRRVGLARIVLASAYWRGPFVGSELEYKWARLKGRLAWLDQEKDYTPNRPLSGATVFTKTFQGDKHLSGTRGGAVTFTDGNGEFEFDGMIDSTNFDVFNQFTNVMVEAYGTACESFVAKNPTAMAELRKVYFPGQGGERKIDLDGSIIFAMDHARPDEYPSSIMLKQEEQSLNLVAFPCKSITLFGLTEPRGYLALKDLTLLDASTESPPFQYGKSTIDLASGAPEENCITIWADPKLRVRMTMGLGLTEKRLILINNTPEKPIGEGFVLNDLEAIPSMVLQGGRDMWNIDQSRLAKFEAHGINNPRVRDFHAEAKQYLDKAASALQARDYRGYRETSEKGWALENKAYNELLSLTNNMIRGVLFYLALLIPFSYCLERLLIASGTIKNRIAWMLGIFGASFAVLALIHPAFRFTLTPFIVLLAFVILALAVTVIFLVMGAVDAMLQERKQAATGLHEDTLNLGSVAMRAVDLGIANIRRRPQRGFLTGMTIVLVTFTLLSFTSLVPEVSVSKLKHPLGQPVYKGLLARNRRWDPLQTPLYESLRRTFMVEKNKPAAASGAGSTVAARAWFYSDWAGMFSQIDLSATSDAGDARGHFTASALLAMQPQEPSVTGVDKALTAGRWFREDGELGVILAEHVVKELGLSAGDLGKPVRVFGTDLPLIGIVNAGKFDALRDIDGEPLTPVDFVAQSIIDAKRSSKDQKADTFEKTVHLRSDQVAIIPYQFGFRLGASIRSVAVRTGEHLNPDAEAEAYARRSSLTILADNGRQVTLFASLDRSRVNVAGQIGIPILLGFMMVLGTMLGSVYERRREIFVYNSVGLSPANVASLFLAESSVYAIIGACMGYLLGQIVSKALLMTGSLSGIGLNYSAGTTVFVTLLTMGIVLVSTLYPARQAFMAAVPEHNAPESEGEAAQDAGGETIDMYLPFVATPNAIFAMQAYLYEYLDSVQGVTVGELAVDDLTSGSGDGGGQPMPWLKFKAWLAPFDLGISHDATIKIVYREDRGVFQYHLTATRASGDQQNWRRLTPRFIQTLRKQLLMWRILSAEDHARYMDKAQPLFGRKTI